MKLNCLRFPSRTSGPRLCDKSTNISTALTSNNSDQKPHQKQPRIGEASPSQASERPTPLALQKSHSAISLLKGKDNESTALRY
ncbi:hypothetical protein EUGRSUZ_F00562 [Eucalyptus grandis]|uniref:Uncharacterized protein n=2 Tax=Eucalyptus grandis TaxID=71139 RepID=A0ACC3KBW5_EUCGR|nr:hypothetical protein EUGRSUZ_F00562 [Eucalyptus grandis]